MPEIILRPATEDDAAEMLALYAPLSLIHI